MKTVFAALTILIANTAFAAKTVECQISIKQNGEIIESANPKKELSLIENPGFSVEGSTGQYGAYITFKSKDGRFAVDVNASQFHQDYNPTVSMRIYDSTTNHTTRSHGDHSAAIESLAGNTETQGYEIVDGIGAVCRIE